MRANLFFLFFNDLYTAQMTSMAGSMSEGPAIEPAIEGIFFVFVTCIQPK